MFFPPSKILNTVICEMSCKCLHSYCSSIVQSCDNGTHRYYLKIKSTQIKTTIKVVCEIILGCMCSTSFYTNVGQLVDSNIEPQGNLAPAGYSKSELSILCVKGKHVKHSITPHHTTRHHNFMPIP